MGNETMITETEVRQRLLDVIQGHVALEDFGRLAVFGAHKHASRFDARSTATNIVCFAALVRVFRWAHNPSNGHAGATVGHAARNLSPASAMNPSRVTFTIRCENRASVAVFWMRVKVCLLFGLDLCTLRGAIPIERRLTAGPTTP